MTSSENPPPDLGVARLCMAASLRCPLAKVTAAKGSVVGYTGAAIVNAANEGMLGGGGIDGAISSAGGDKLYQARKALPVLSTGHRVRCRTGDAKTTVAGELPCEWVIHAVGPNYHGYCDEGEADVLLYSAYASAMREARRRGLKDVGFSLISAGIFRAGRPLKDVLAIGMLACAACTYEGLEEAVLVGYTRQEVELLAEVVEELLLHPNAADARSAFLSTLPRPLVEMHARALAGEEHDEPPVGLGIAWAAASASASAPSSDTPVDMSDA
jgi:O-acetyl-ADP-ribose deacetylase (regulator of RNase III)